MRKAILVITVMLMVVACSSLALADTQYTITGTYDGLTSTSAVSAANGNFSFTFGIGGSTLAGDAGGLFGTISPTFTFNGSNPLSGPMFVVFNPAGVGSPTPNLDITYFDAQNFYSWIFAVDSPLFGVNGLELVAGTFPILGDGTSSLTFSEPGNFGFGTISGGSITATPEPGAFLLMGSGILALGGAIRRKLFA
jgi:hypothetical protein